jgi:nicotinamidase/pyrazinamidase
MKTVFFDVDTQIDFLYPAGALYTPGAEKLIDNIASLNRSGNIVVSTVDAHSEDDPEFKLWPHHCVAGTVGQQKPQATLLDRRMIVPNSPSVLDLGDAQQIILEKQTIDCFTNVNIYQLLDLLAADLYVVYGVVTEICVQKAAFGLLQTGKPVELVTDATQSLSPQAQEEMFTEFVRLGGRLSSAIVTIAPFVKTTR